MTFKIKTSTPGKLPIYMLKQEARQFVLLCQKDATDELMDRYLKEKYNITLTAACLYLIDNATYSTNTTDTIFISFIDTFLPSLSGKFKSIISSFTLIII